MRKPALCLILAALLWGCMTSPARKYYQIHLHGGAAAGLPSFDRSLRVDPVAADSLYDDFRILFRVSPYEVNFYSYDFWAEKPAKLIGDAISHFLARRALFPRVTQSLTGPEPDLVLKSRIHVIEEIDDKDAWRGRLSMDLEFQEYPSGRTLLLRHFDRTEALPEKAVTHLPAVISRILEEELTRALADLAGKI